MSMDPAIVVLGTFDSKGEEHFFIKNCVERRGLRTLTVNVGTKCPSPFPVDIDLYPGTKEEGNFQGGDRDLAIADVVQRATALVKTLFQNGRLSGIISAGGGTGTHMATRIMKALPLGIPKVMVSTVASRNMASTVGTKDITMIHSVVDLLGINSISGRLLDRAAGAVCGMSKTLWEPSEDRKRIALPFFGFVTQGAERIKSVLEEMGYEVIPFHANGIGGMAMEELANEGHFHAIIDFATHEFADALMGGYCGGIGPGRLEPVQGRTVPRLVVPGGLDCAVLEFTRDHIPETYRNRKIFFYDFRSAIRLNASESLLLAGQLAEKLNRHSPTTKVLVPTLGWSEADREGGPLYDPEISRVFMDAFRRDLKPHIQYKEVDFHINDPLFARLTALVIDKMLKRMRDQ